MNSGDHVAKKTKMWTRKRKELNWLDNKRQREEIRLKNKKLEMNQSIRYS